SNLLRAIFAQPEEEVGVKGRNPRLPLRAHERAFSQVSPGGTVQVLSPVQVKTLGDIRPGQEVLSARSHHGQRRQHRLLKSGQEASLPGVGVAHDNSGDWLSNGAVHFEFAGGATATAAIADGPTHGET